MPGRVVSFFKNAMASKLFTATSETTIYPNSHRQQRLKSFITVKSESITI